MERKAVQDCYAEKYSHCYGCGRLNDHGLKIKSYWNGQESVAIFTPKSYHTAMPGFVYGGLIASIIDCHGTGTAVAAAHQKGGGNMGADIPLRYVTASLHVDFIAPTPLGVPLEARGRVREIKDRKVVVSITLSAEDKVCARGEVVAVQIPKGMMQS
jgi:acyl-coenzyme A thioesterase PaaI-like protein